MSLAIVQVPNAPGFDDTTDMPPPSSATSGAGGTSANRPAPGTGGTSGVPRTAPASFPLTDYGNAERLVARHGDDLRYVRARGWFVWDGKRWAFDETGEVMRRAKSTVRAIYAEAATINDKHAREEMAEHAIDSEQRPRLEAMIALAATEARIAVTMTVFDTDPWLLNVDNGTIDLHTGTLRSHRRNDLITKLAPVAYDPTAVCPSFEKFLSEVQPDPTVRAYMKRHAGYSISGVIREHVLKIDYGDGRNGKGVYTNTALRILGDYGTMVPTELLLASKSDRHPTERAVLLGVRFAAASESEQNRQLATALVKQLTGGDPITARYMNKDFFTFAPTHKLVLATNHRPVIRETKGAIWQRVHLVPWNVVFPPEKQNLKLAEDLWIEAPGILRWMVEGCLEWQRVGLAPPPIVVAATAQYRVDMDLLGDFLGERCILDVDARVTRSELRVGYETWANEVGLERPLDARGFAEALRERGIEEVKVRTPGSKPERGWKGIRLRTDADPDDDGAERVATRTRVDADPEEASRAHTPGPGGEEPASTRDHVATNQTRGPADKEFAF